MKSERMKNIAFIGLAFVTCFLFSCGKASKFAGGFSKFTPTNTNGENVGTIDPTDWRLDDKFTKAENALFDDSLVNKGQCVLGSNRVVVYPNANNGNFFFSFDQLSVFNLVEDLHFVVLNQNFQTIKTGTININQSLGTVIIDCSSLVNNGDFLRIYYILRNNSCSYRGHGDIKIIK